MITGYNDHPSTQMPCGSDDFRHAMPGPSPPTMPPDAVQRLDQTGDAAGFNDVANVGLHAAELKPRIVRPLHPCSC